MPLPCVFKATHPGLLKVSGLQEGVYTFKMTVTDTAGQKSSDDVSVTVLAPRHQAEGKWRPEAVKSKDLDKRGMQREQTKLLQVFFLFFFKSIT